MNRLSHMLGMYLQIALRNLLKNKVFSLINMTGLALGAACSLMIGLAVQDETSMDQFLKDKDRRFAVYQREYADGQVTAGYATPAQLGEELKRVIPEIQYAANTEQDFNAFRVNGKLLHEGGYYAGSDFFQVFGFPVLLGEASQALQDPEGAAISRKMAIASFGSPEAAMGKAIEHGNDKQPFVVRAVFDNLPRHSSMQLDYVLNWKAFLRDNAWGLNWGSTGTQTTILLKPGASPQAVESKIRRFLDHYYLDQGPGLREELALQPYAEKYLHSEFRNGVAAGGRIDFVRIFSITALFVLLIACINFVNLVTARSVKRAREVGVRKVIGAGRVGLINQFMVETMLLVFASIGLGLLLVTLFLPYFDRLTGKQVAFPSSSPAFWLEVLTLGLITGFMSGLYPAFYLSGMQPVRVLKGVVRFSARAVGFRKGLVVFQFILSIVLITATLVVFRQMNYVRTLDLGYAKDNLLLMDANGNLSTQFDVFRQQAGAIPGIVRVSRMGGSPTWGAGGYEDDVRWPGKDPNYRPTFGVMTVGYNFIQTIGLHLVQGRDFSTQFGTDSAAFLINKSAAEKMGLTSPLGHTLTLETGKKGTIIGVIKDAHFSSLRDNIDPLIMSLDNKQGGTILVRIAPGHIRETMAGLKRLCTSMNPGSDFSYRFADVAYEKLYANEELAERMGAGFAFLAILISCLGLLGLSLFTVESRTKEIGIRKVLGAGAANLFTLISAEFLSLVAIAFVIAVPVSAWAMTRWLEGFAYHTALSWWLFCISGILSLLIALVTVSVQALRVAIMSPVKSLRTD